MNLGDYPSSAVIDFKWNSQGLDGASITRETDGGIRIYRNASTTQRSSAAGITDTEDFAGIVGVHHLRIDTSDNTDGGFYQAGNEYQVVLVGAVVDGKTVNTTLAHFSIERAGGILALLKGAVGLLAIKTETASLQTDVDDIQARLPATLVSGRMDASVGAMAANVLTDTAINADAITAAKIASGAIDAATFAAGAINAAAIATDAITAGKIAPDAIGASEVAADAVVKIQNGLATSVSISNLNNVSVAQVNAEMLDVLFTDTYSESASVPAATSSLAAKIVWIGTLARNKITQTATTQALRNDSDSGNIATSTVSDDTTTFTRGEWT